jgi:mycothiol synthase
VAAAAAWHKEIDGVRWGMIHWVGATSTARGQGLGKIVTLAALHRLRERGFTRAMLDTDIWRLPAVAAYLRLGFRPWPTEAAPQEVWARVLADLDAWRKNRDPR